VTSVPGSGFVIYHPAVEIVDGVATVSWVVASQEGWRAYTRTIGRDGTQGPVIELDDNAIHLYSLTMPDRSLAWIADHENRTTLQRELRLLRLEGSRVVRAAAAPSPFTGFFRVQPSSSDEVLLVGPQMGRVPPETPVRSLILRLSTSC
jgi:hypothetical protein